MTRVDRGLEEWHETQARYLATYGIAGLRSMAAEYRTAQRMGEACLLPPRYAIAARVLADLATSLSVAS